MADALAEDKFDPSFSKGMAARIESMNNAQLSGIRQYLEPTVARSKFTSWRVGNAKVLNEVDAILGGRLRKIEAEIEAETKLDDKATSKFDRSRDKLQEKRDMRDQTRRNAARTARQQVIDFEKQRKADEKLAMVKQIPLAEELRFQYIYAAGVFLIVGTVIVTMIFKDAIGIAIGMVAVAMMTGGIGYRAYLVGLVLPKEVSEEEIERAVMIREEEIFLKAMNTQKRKHIEHKAAVVMEKEYRKKVRAEEAEAKAINDAILNVDLDNFEQMIELDEPEPAPLGEFPEFREDDFEGGLGSEEKEEKPGSRPESREHKDDLGGNSAPGKDEANVSHEILAMRELSGSTGPVAAPSLYGNNYVEPQLGDIENGL
jgi:hypothetical protein